MAGDGVPLVVVTGGAACRDAAEALWPGVPCAALTREELRPPAPFAGRLFDLLAARPRGSTVGVVAPVTAAAAGATRPADAIILAPGDLVAVADHVNLEARGPLTGRWPAGVPRDFPSTTGIYQPALVRPRPGARVYSSGVVAAGVADARRLTRFEARAVGEGGWPIVSDSLV
ncbi:MAG TPA: hypothetical protein VK576_05140, partial [Thermoleophilia bacterium]|nr:hypothetical protein [Thermoleophilia bacterium]